MNRILLFMLSMVWTDRIVTYRSRDDRCVRVRSADDDDIRRRDKDHDWSPASDVHSHVSA